MNINPRKILPRLTALTVVVVVTAACSPTGGSAASATTLAATTTAPTSSSSSVTTSSTTAPTTQPSAPMTTVAKGDFETASCGELTGVLLCEAYELIERHYVDPIASQDLVEGAVEGLSATEVEPGAGIEVCPLPTPEFEVVCNVIDAEDWDPDAAEEVAVAGMVFMALDPNSAYFDADALSLIEEEQSGEVEGIGAIVATEEEGSELPNSCQVIGPTCRLRIVSTIDGGPARAADLRSEDEFITVDGQSIEGWTVEEVTAAVRGPAGTPVELTFLRDGSEFTVTIVRAQFQVTVVESEMVGDVAYLRLNIFTDNADEQLRSELEDLLANDPAALVLDLRNNPGGLLDTAVNVTSEFISEGLVVSTKSPEATTPYEVEPGGLATGGDLPMYVVVNEGSASASEVVAGALADADRATIVGENTFGKNTVQQRFPLSNGGALKLTIARWFTPEGHDFGGDGITPDVAAELPVELSVPDLVARVVPAGTTAAG